MSVQQHPPINTNWSIDTSAKSVISFGVDVLAATLSDNVHPLAYLACERYGATLAMCPESCAKVEKLAKREHTCHILSLIGVSVGFAPNDVADKLASNEAGGKIIRANPKPGSIIRATKPYGLRHSCSHSRPASSRLSTWRSFRLRTKVVERVWIDSTERN